MGVKLQSTQKVSTVHSYAAMVTPGPVITSVVVTDSSYNAIDDTAVSTAGGYIKVFGTMFETGCVLYVGGVAATSTAFVSSSEIRCQLAATASNTQVVYVVNPSGSAAVYLSGILFSGVPAWSTSATLPDSGTDTAFSVSLSATSDSSITYSLAAGSSLPPGTALSSAGVFSGTVTGLALDTTYSFSVVATDLQLQDTARTFSITFTVGDAYFNYTTLLLTGDGSADAATNNTLLDSSTNNYTLTRAGTPTVGSFSPHSPAGWSNYFDGSGDYVQIPSSANLSPGTVFTFEAWIYLPIAAVAGATVYGAGAGGEMQIGYEGTGNWGVAARTTAWRFTSTTIPIVGQWNHIVVSRGGTGTNQTSLFLNGTRVANGTVSDAFTGTTSYQVGFDAGGGGVAWNGYISNLRLVKGVDVYGYTNTTITVPTVALTAIANTQLLTCQNNSFKDNSTNNFALTPAGEARVQAFSPFKPSAAYSAALHGGSVYKIRTDYHTVSTSASLITFTGDFTLEAWVYPTVTTAGDWGLIDARNSGGAAQNWVWTLTAYSGGFLMSFYTAGVGRNNATRIPAYAWTHVAVVRTGTTLKYYINGIVDANTYSVSGTINGAASGDVFLLNTKDYTVSAAWGSEGYITDLRVVNGTAVYATNFTPPTAPLTAVANTTLLLNCTTAGVADATTKNVLQTVGDTRISTAIKKYGTGSIYLNPSYATAPTGYLFGAASTTASFGTGNFTVEFWFRWVTTANRQDLFWWKGTQVAGILWNLTAGNLTYYINGGQINAPLTPTVDTWYHIALTRSSGTSRLFINGVQGGSSYADATSYTGTYELYSGRDQGASSNWVNGYIDELRITRGVARYTAAFTPPTAAQTK